MKKIKVFVSVLLICLFLFPLNCLADDKTTGQNWMENVSDSAYLNQINMPGSHDSCTKKVLLPLISKCQKETIEEQLNDGVRVLDIRFVAKKDKIYAVHGIDKCFVSTFKRMTTTDVINTCYDFLDKNPSETIVFMLSQGNGEPTEDLYNLLYKDYISKNTDKWYMKNNIPQLKDVRGKLVFMRRCAVDSEKYGDDTGLNIQQWPGQESTDTIEYESFDVKNTKDEKVITANIQDRYKLKVDDKFKAYENLLNKQNDNDLNINYLSTTDHSRPKYGAKRINEKFLQNEFSPKSNTIVMFDYVNNDLAKQVYESNFE